MEEFFRLNRALFDREPRRIFLCRMKELRLKQTLRS
jgi:hypothetical protein